MDKWLAGEYPLRHIEEVPENYSPVILTITPGEPETALEEYQPLHHNMITKQVTYCSRPHGTPWRENFQPDRTVLIERGFSPGLIIVAQRIIRLSELEVLIDAYLSLPEERAREALDKIVDPMTTTRPMVLIHHLWLMAKAQELQKREAR